MNKLKARLVAMCDKQGNEINLPTIQLRYPQLSERQIRCCTQIPKFGPRTGTHPLSVYNPAESFLIGMRHFGHYLAALIGATDSAPTAYHSRIDGALTNMEMQ